MTAYVEARRYGASKDQILSEFADEYAYQGGGRATVTGERKFYKDLRWALGTGRVVKVGRPSSNAQDIVYVNPKYAHLRREEVDP